MEDRVNCDWYWSKTTITTIEASATTTPCRRTEKRIYTGSVAELFLVQR